MLTFHSNTINGRRATVVGRFTPESNELQLAVAVCSPRDNFNRKRGRVIALGRLEKTTHPKKEVITITGEFNNERFIVAAQTYANKAVEDTSSMRT